MTETTERNYSGIANYRLAICKEFLDEPAAPYYKAAQGGNELLDDDYYAKKKSETYLRRNISETEKSIIMAANLIEQKKFDAAVDSLTILLNSTQSQNLYGQTALLLSEAYYYQNKYDSSLIFAQKALAEKSRIESSVIPFANYFASSASFKKGDKEKAKYYFEKADNSSNFFYENKLKSMLKNLSRFVNN